MGQDALTQRYLPVLIVIIISFIIGFSMLLISRLIRPKRPYTLKLTPYECGIPSTEDTWERFNVKFYIVALVFVIFDVEIIFLYPWALVYKKIGFYALLEMYLFIFILLIGYFYAIGKKVFNWSKE
ncbi:NADH ubiquinone oxidoreductase chain A [Thermodesulfovibrio sp. N1]|jgi:NADH-quinone oxidoreductase subunit A|uniref:NADH-quinone oxidoreductase subunit A n=1 Tax=unclassified Thermodesulfovibrio TaxID=2645936 RepID=UPI00083B2253|nr:MULTISPECIES: NADH-quinone oxidoreductase subunit A [unclassified Thermodesulfovibrio]MDI1471415.1 NADH-quinone oxidoreductase subunit A [Thermodesulfovibrio sp. 1176]ODA43743.1 NADH ubiquinone oxidoreductase chain A [Thermodesulfovibrio sp. N1]